MGRLLENLRAEIQGQPPATPATPATQAPKSSRVASVAAPPVVKTPESVPHETELRARCKIACEGLPILPTALYAAMSEADRGAQLSGEEGPEVLRAFAESICEGKQRGEPELPPGVARAYTRLRRQLTEHPSIRTAVEVVDPDSDQVLLAIAVRGAGYVCLKTPQVHYDGFKLLELVHRWNNEAHPK